MTAVQSPDRFDRIAKILLTFGVLLLLFLSAWPLHAAEALLVPHSNPPGIIPDNGIAIPAWVDGILKALAAAAGALGVRGLFLVTTWLKTKNNSAVAAFVVDQFAAVIRSVVGDLAATMAREYKLAKADGKLTPDEIGKLRDAALKQVKSTSAMYLWKLLVKYITGDQVAAEKLVQGWVENEVSRVKLGSINLADTQAGKTQIG